MIIALDFARGVSEREPYSKGKVPKTPWALTENEEGRMSKTMTLAMST